MVRGALEAGQFVQFNVFDMVSVAILAQAVLAQAVETE